MSRGSPLVLIVENNPDISGLEAAIAHRSGCSTAVATGRTAVEALRSSPPDVVILGSPVEVGPGIDLLDMLDGPLRGLASRTIVVTTYVEDVALLTRAARAGVFAVVAEPFDVELLCNLITRCAAGNECELKPTWVGVPPVVISDVYDVVEGASPALRA